MILGSLRRVAFSYSKLSRKLFNFLQSTLMPNTLLKHLLVFAILFSCSTAMWATHNRAGEISVRQVDCPGFELEAIVITYTRSTSPVDRDSVLVNWGDGTEEWVARENGPQGGASGVPQGELLGNAIQRNVYRARHVYPGRGTYRISMTDPNRNAGIVNLNDPSSDAVRFHLQTTYTFLDPQFDGCNNTPILLQPPIDIGCINQPFTHNPGAFDLEGDSLSYELTVPLADIGMEAPRYFFPHFCCGNIGSSFTMDPITGDVRWENPQSPGEYNFAFHIISWRNSVPIDTVLRDVQITIEDCNDNQAPMIETVDEICVVAGELIEFNVRASDPDSDDRLQLTAQGGPFAVVDPKADVSFNDTRFLPQVLNRTFRWQTTCDHISLNPYTVVFRAVDNDQDTTGLATLKSVRIRVVGPPPEGLDAVAGSGQIELFWDRPYVCEDAADDYFIGFSVWRREGSNNFVVDNCEPGLAGRGYTQVRLLTEEVQDGQYYYFDGDVERGRTYCYRILAKFARFSNANPPQPFNIVESLASEEVCVQLSRDVPLITKVSVERTDPQNGAIQVEWTKPAVTDLDTLVNPGPYRYQLQRATGQGVGVGGFQPVAGAVFDSPFFATANDTTFLDETGINTLNQSYTYRVAFFVNDGEPLGDAAAASSEFLTFQPQDEALRLNWSSVVPWSTDSFLVYRQNLNTNLFELLATTNERTYLDAPLVNGREYCYFIEAIGSYGIDGVPDPLINLSQEACGVPEDLEPPCAPSVSINNLCDQPIDCATAVLENTVRWVDPATLPNCEASDDVVGYSVYFAATENEELTLLATIDDPTVFEFVHGPEGGIAGCYAVTAIDSFQNESPFSTILCTDNCPEYELPNAFTPNGDGQNDRFVPRANCFINSVNFQVFNRWGNLVFETTDPTLNWDGTDLNGNALPDGTYFYRCILFETRVSGIERGATELSGYIELLKGR